MVVLVQKKGRNSSSSDTTVNNREAADFLANPQTAYYLYPFIGRERSASDVAQAYGLPINAVLYRIGRMIKLGLLRQSSQKPRSGRAVKLYRAVADSFYVPLKQTSQVALEDLVTQWARAFEELYAQSFAKQLLALRPDWGLRISRERDGRLMIAPANRPDCFYDYFQENAPTLVEGWFNDLWLDDADAKEFQQELMMLYLRYLGREGKRRFLLRVGMAPLEGRTLPEW
jgi:hypothetical protein